MAIPNWGMLQKSQSDAETIEEAIVRLIDEHNADETSHLDTGESLQSHKAAEIIDHLAESIVYDKLALGSVDQRKLSLDQFYVFTAFESLDGWSFYIDSGCTAVAHLLGAKLDMPATSGKSITMFFDRPFGSYLIDFDKFPFFQTSLSISDPDQMQAYWGVGEFSLFDPAAQWFGFYYYDAALHAFMIVDSVSDSWVIPDINLAIAHVYRADYNPDTNDINWYVDGVLVKTASADLPSGVIGPVFTYYMHNSENAVKQMTILDLLFSQSR